MSVKAMVSLMVLLLVEMVYGSCCNSDLAIRSGFGYRNLTYAVYVDPKRSMVADTSYALGIELYLGLE